MSRPREFVGPERSSKQKSRFHRLKWKQAKDEAVLLYSLPKHQQRRLNA